MKKIFIDGREGTTGLRIYERLAEFNNIEIIVLPENLRKDTEARKNALNSCDIAFLCLPDIAAIQAVSMIENENVVVIDTSTAHRTNKAWAYGLPELSEAHKEKIIKSKRIAVPGCYPSGFIALVYPLIQAGIIDKELLLTCSAVSGYSGGGKSLIATYEDENRACELDSLRLYALSQEHKHIKEMKAQSGLCDTPIFCPSVADYYNGMIVTVPLFKKQLNNGKSAEDIKALYREIYNSEIIKYVDDLDKGGAIFSNSFADYDNMHIGVCGNEERILLTAVYDNLGKGASGAAIECLNLILGNALTFALNIKE
jgi:N-acetyl-gamma-glutamyl-phosphate reductase